MYHSSPPSHPASSPTRARAGGRKKRGRRGARRSSRRGRVLRHEQGPRRWTRSARAGARRGPGRETFDQVGGSGDVPLTPSATEKDSFHSPSKLRVWHSCFGVVAGVDVVCHDGVSETFLGFWVWAAEGTSDWFVGTHRDSFCLVCLVRPDGLEVLLGSTIESPLVWESFSAVLSSEVPMSNVKIPGCASTPVIVGVGRHHGGGGALVNVFLHLLCQLVLYSVLGSGLWFA